MSVETRMRTALLANASLAALIGTRMYPVQFAQGFTTPAIAFQLMPGQQRPYSMKQVGNSEWGKLAFARYQFTCAGGGASGSEQARTVAQALKDAVLGVDLSKNPVVTGGPSPNFVLSEWEMDQPNTTPAIFLRFVDIRMFIREEN